MIKSHMISKLFNGVRSTAVIISIALGLIACDGEHQTSQNNVYDRIQDSADFIPTLKLDNLESQTRAPKPTASPRPIESNIVNLDAEGTISKIADTLENGHDKVVLSLRSAGLGEVVEKISQVDGMQMHDIESESLIREVYFRAESHTAGQGERLLAYLYKDAAAKFPAVAEDPMFSELRTSVAKYSELELNPELFKFSDSYDLNKIKMDAKVERAIRSLAEVYSHGNVSQLRSLARKAFGRNLRFGDHLARSNSTEDVLRSIAKQHVASGRPPPIKEAMRTMLSETSRFPAALDNQKFINSLMELSPQELKFNPSTDQVYEQIAENQDSLPSRIAQIAQAKSIDGRGSILKASSSSAENHINRVTTSASRAITRAGISISASAQHYANYVYGSFKSAGSEREGGTGGKAYKVSASKSALGSAIRRSAGPKISKTYTSAIRSARAARGVAAGAALKVPNSATLTGIAWMPNPDDDRFGRIVVEAEDSTIKRKLFISRTLFADSFFAAQDALWGGHYGVTKFNEGDIFVVMSMDPFNPADPKAAEEIQRKANELKRQILSVEIPSEEQQMNILLEGFLLEAAAAKLPRRVVIHPALHGTELAWSATRVDFWLNDLDGLNQESKAVNGGLTMPSKFSNIDISEAQTWQFFELENSVRLEHSAEDKLGIVSIISKGLPSNVSSKSHFGVSMFVLKDEHGQVYQDGKRLESLENEIQPMLNWLAFNHHDFMRLNDFSEAFSLLRWAVKDGVAPTLLDFDGRSDPITTPDRVVGGEGPKVK